MKAEKILYLALAMIIGMVFSSCADGGEPDPGKTNPTDAFANIAKSEDGSVSLFPAVLKVVKDKEIVIYVEAEVWWIDDVIINDVHHPTSDYAKTDPFNFYNVYGELGGYVVTTSQQQVGDKKIEAIKVKGFLENDVVEIVVATPTGKCSALISYLDRPTGPALDSNYSFGGDADFVAPKEGMTKSVKMYSQKWGLRFVIVDGIQVLSMFAQEQQSCWNVGDFINFDWFAVSHETDSMEINIAPNKGARRSFYIVASNSDPVTDPKVWVRCTQLGVDD